MGPKRKHGGVPADAHPWGGHRQRAATSASSAPPSSLAAWLYQQWCWGAFSPQQVQEIARHAKADVAAAVGQGSPEFSYKDLDNLAKLGTSGAYAGGMHHQMVALVNPSIYATPCEWRVPFKRGNGWANVQQTALWPHEFFAHMFANHRPTFTERVVPDRARINEFWAAVQHSEQFLTHPARHREDLRDFGIPLVLHCDGVPCTGVGKSWGKSFDAWHWNSALGTGNTLSQCFYIYGLFTRLISKVTLHNTLNKFYKKLRWSFLALLRGEWPYEDSDGVRYDKRSKYGKLAGKKLAEGFFGILWVIRGDLDMHFKHFQLPPKGYNSKKPCFRCPCDRSTMPFDEVGPHARWIEHVYTAAFPVPHVFFACNELGVTILTVHQDYMHCKHIGTDQWFLGGFLHLLIYTLSAGGTPADRLEHLWDKVKSYYRAHPCPGAFNNMTLEMITSTKSPWKKSPKLKGRAGEIKRIWKPLLAIWEEHKIAGDPVHSQIHTAMLASIKMDEILDEHSPMQGHFKLPTEAATIFKEATAVYVECHKALSVHFKPTKRFNFTIKGHCLIHISMLSSDLNPRCAWCYMPEDYMHKIKKLVQSCCRGVNVEALGQKVCLKIAIAMGLHMTESDSWFA